MKLFRYTFAFYFFFVAINLSFAQIDIQKVDIYNSLTIPKALKENADEVLRKDYKKFTIDDPRRATLKVKKVVTLLNNNSTENVQYIHYNKDRKITNLSAKIFDAFGKEVRKVKGKDFEDQSAVSRGTIYSDSRIKKAELNHNSYPYTIEISYTKIYKQTLFYPNSYLQSYGRSVENYEFIVETPDDFGLNYKNRNTTLEPVIKNQDGKTNYTWSARHLPAIKFEPYAPYREKIVPAILLAPNQFQYEKYTGSMSSWKSFGNFIYTLNHGQDVLTPTMAKLVNELTANASTDQEKIKILYQYLQDNMRYVSVQLGIGGWQSFDAAYVEKNKYGDCKALSNFMKSMLNEVGIESNWAVIYRGDRYKPEMDQDFVNSDAANHMILNVPSEDMWLECTSNDYPINYLGGDNQDRTALLVTPDGGIITHTPLYGLDQNKTINTTAIKLSDQGAAVIEQHIEYMGPSHDHYRYYSNNLSQEDLEKHFLQNSDLPAFTIDKLAILNDKDRPKSTMDYNISVPRYASKAGKRIFLPLNKLNPFEEVPKVMKKRKYPVHVKTSYTEEDIYTYHTPDGFELESVQEQQINFESEFGKYQVEIIVAEGSITYKRLLEIHAVELPAERYDDLRNFYKEIVKADGIKAVLVKKKS